MAIPVRTKDATPQIIYISDTAQNVDDVVIGITERGARSEGASLNFIVG